jgi:hypothetical protein
MTILCSTSDIRKSHVMMIDIQFFTKSIDQNHYMRIQIKEKTLSDNPNFLQKGAVILKLSLSYFTLTLNKLPSAYIKHSVPDSVHVQLKFTREKPIL